MNVIIWAYIYEVVEIRMSFRVNVGRRYSIKG